MRTVRLVAICITFLALAASAYAMPSSNCGGCDGGGNMPPCTAAIVGWYYNVSGTWYKCARTITGSYRWVYA
jgi:hypothetical protein